LHFLLPIAKSAILAYAAIVLLGISFSLVPAALWPSVPKLIDEKLLGSAYAIIFWIQNIGLYAFPMIIGSLLDKTNKGVTDPTKLNYTVPMVMLACLGVLALILGVWLKAEDKKKGYGLEKPNIEQ
jgi:MFS family permease